MKTKIKSLLFLATLMAVTLVTGCGSFATLNDNTPHTTIKGSISGQPFEIRNPKDTILTGLQVTASTNGNASITIQSLTTVMKTENIAATGEATSKNTEAIFTGIHQVMQDTAALAKEGAAALAK